MTQSNHARAITDPSLADIRRIVVEARDVIDTNEAKYLVAFYDMKAEQVSLAIPLMSYFGDTADQLGLVADNDDFERKSATMPSSREVDKVLRIVI